MSQVELSLGLDLGAVPRSFQWERDSDLATVREFSTRDKAIWMPNRSLLVQVLLGEKLPPEMFLYLDMKVSLLVWIILSNYSGKMSQVELLLDLNLGSEPRSFP